jgi:hypothetical protein
MTDTYIDPQELESEWQARILGIVATLIDRGTLTWPEFRDACVRLRSGDVGPDRETDVASNDEAWADLEDWAPALRRLLETRGLLPPNEQVAEPSHG